MAEPVRVPLPHGQMALIDADDAERILAYRWHLKRKRNCKRVYVQRTVRLGSGRDAAALDIQGWPFDEQRYREFCAEVGVPA